MELNLFSRMEMVYLDVQRYMMSNLMLKALISPKKLDLYADPSDPSNPFVHHAPDPGTEMLPEQVKLSSLVRAGGA